MFAPTVLVFSMNEGGNNEKTASKSIKSTCGDGMLCEIVCKR